jgi:hypothetical protein
MARSICIKCGQTKSSPLHFCPHCGFVPKEVHDQARSILLSDKHRTPLELDAAASDVRRRQVLIFEPSELQPILARLERDRASHVFGVRRSTWLIIGAALTAGAIAAAITILLQSG